MSAWSSFLDHLRLVAAARLHHPALIEDGSRTLTYAELVEQTNQLAALLRQKAIGKGSVVALAVGRSADHVIGMLAAWRLGAAFLPLDCRWPDDRLAFILRDAAVKKVLTTADLARRFQRLGADVIDPPSSLPGAASDLPPVALSESDLAYIIYTSGSTGQSKGVAVEHRGIVNLIDAQNSAFQLTSDSRSLWLLSPAFDASLSDIGTVLLAGAVLHVEPADELRDPIALVRLLHRRQITHLDLPPALLAVLDPQALPDSLQTLIIGGEPSPPALVRTWAQRFRMVNVYGPTEATVCTSLCVCDPDTWQEPLLGQPLPNIS